MTVPITTQSNGNSPGGLNTPVACEQWESFDWHAWYLEKRDAFTLAAKTWRQIAHTCQLAGDHDGVRMAHGNALENEAWAKDAESKAKQFRF